MHNLAPVPTYDLAPVQHLMNRAPLPTCNLPPVPMYNLAPVPALGEYATGASTW